ncbi:MAG: fibronectin type III domain-containing protein [Oscillospiraceae bacterium]|jgi:hypothetical protein|nr:fibronectin type III domain-containing protein [Oscillospiraceae bacterium]
MKLWKACLLALLVIAGLAASAALSESGDDEMSKAEWPYQALIEMFDEAMNSEELYTNLSEDALTELGKARRIAEQVSGYKDSAQWIIYIDGVVALLNKDYQQAQELFSRLDDPGFHNNANALLAFANGQLLERSGDIINAALQYKAAGEFLKTEAEAMYEKLTNPQFIRAALLKYIEGKQYSHVIAMVDQLEANYIDVPQAALYKSYVMGLIEMENPDVKDEDTRLANALPYFEAGAAEHFLDSEAEAADIKARRIELSGNLRGAVAAYVEALAIAKADAVSGDSLNYSDSRLPVCQDALYKQADGLYQKGAAALDRDSYRQAKELFVFLGGYENSAARAEEVQAAINDIPIHDIANLDLYQVEATTIKLSWEDAVDGPWEVTVRPTGMRFPVETFTTNRLYYTIDNLLPDTAYSIDVKGQIGESKTLTGNAKTKEVALFTAQGFELDVPDTLYQYKLSEERTIELVNMVAHAKDKNKAWELIRLYGELPLPKSSLEDADIGFVVAPELLHADHALAELTWMVRMALTVDGVGVVDYTKQHKVADAYFIGLCLELNPLLDKLYEQNGSWPTGEARLDAYIDDTLLMTDTLRLTALSGGSSDVK